MIYKPRVRDMLTLLVALFGVSACDELSGPGTNDDGTPEDQVQFFEELTLSQFQDIVDTRQVRVEILIAEGTVAREVEIELAREFSDEEEVTSRVASVDQTGANGTITLQLADLQIGFTSDTRFRTASGDEIMAEEFWARVNAVIEEGDHPAVRARRAPPSSPQDGNDPTFVADELRLLEEFDGSRIAMNMTTANFMRNDAPPPDGWIEVLGLDIEIRVSEGITRLIIEGPDADEAVEFEGRVRTVDPERGTLTLHDGTVVRIIDRTHIRHDDEHPGLLTNLRQVAEALASDRVVIAYGEGMVERENPLTLVAIKIAMKVRENEVPGEEFEGLVRRVDLEAGTAVLHDGTIIRIGEDTRIKEADGFLPSLRAVQEALANDREVVAFGEGRIEGREPLTILAFHVGFLVRHDPAHVEDFEGVVGDVLVDQGRFELQNGIVVLVGEDTRIKDAEGFLPSLQAVVDAQNEGKTVVAYGEGEVEGREPLTIAAFHVAFAVREPPTPVEDFEDVVTAIDLEHRKFTLESGVIVSVDGETTWDDEPGHLTSLEAMHEARTGGQTVVAYGHGAVLDREPLHILAAHVGAVVRVDTP